MLNCEQIAISRYAKATGKPITTSQQVTIINLNDLNIQELPDLSKFVNAQKLFAANSKLKTIFPANIKLLEDADFSHNELETVPDIASDVLFTLNLSHNRLKLFKIDRFYPHLMELNLSLQRSDYTFDENFNAFLTRNAPKLRKLYLNGVGISTLDLIRDCSLTVLEVENNMISELAQLQFLPKTLQVLKLAGNPVAKVGSCFDFVCFQCPGIILYNGKEWTEKQVEFSGLKYARGLKGKERKGQ
ncbi:hypothetical protein SS50377_20848 [Spironucleus salmonicida]|uniref:Leucine rich repeat-containing protein n=1 Tax=Spironucleus salmonicida TaxID=348837 RepID=V6LII5_9EUKA|nr:hypothetical protein SS50377_20848 [Spironucleus salmonicida]|eukprot:EST43526.1 hypothetical protein SS50377_16561 [Spironucleus salmonicida]